MEQYMNFRSKEIYLHNIMCINGGFLGGYCLLCRSGNFGSAQTTNMIQILFNLFGNNLKDFFMRILGLFIYCLGIFICIFLSRKKLIHMQQYAICINFIGLILLSLFPKNINPLVGILPVFFMTSTQWSVFHGTENYNCSTIFSTNNLRQCICSLINYVIDKKDSQKEKALFYGLTLFWYHVGIILSFAAIKILYIHASLIGIPFMFFAWILTYKK